MSSPILNVDRRTTLRWLAGAVAMGQLAACGEVGGSPWAELEPIKAKGYGTDPELHEAKAPWPLTLTKKQLLTTAAAADLIMPADGASPSASQVGVPAFIDEWVSAPYEQQNKDRNLIVPGLAWLDQQSRAHGGRDFAKAKLADQKAVLDQVAYTGKVKPEFEKAGEFFRRFRSLTVGAYFTTEEGWKDIGYQGNSPIDGPYPGPTPEANAHMKKLVESLGLKFTPP
jgi:hypothetical protein